MSPTLTNNYLTNSGQVAFSGALLEAYQPLLSFLRPPVFSEDGKAPRVEWVVSGKN